MRIIKTAQFEGLADLFGHGDHHSGGDALHIDDEQSSIHPIDHGLEIDLDGHGHQGDEGDDYADDNVDDDLGDHIHDVVDNVEEEDPDDVEISMHMDAPNDLGGDLPTDINISPEAFGAAYGDDDLDEDDEFGDNAEHFGDEQEDFGPEDSLQGDQDFDQGGDDIFGHEGDDNFNDLSFDGELDGDDIDFDDINEARPNGEKEDLAGEQFETEDPFEGEFEDEGGHGGSGPEFSGLGDYDPAGGALHHMRAGGYYPNSGPSGAVGEEDDIGDPGEADHFDFGDGKARHQPYGEETDIKKEDASGRNNFFQ